ncbi:hypothetical protein [Polaromonas sp.]|jgi:hypothetical protein|uniref:hypothetical protein n=1 Tax=Polaromonas sp. TaxID=1869339 RepID=UPI002488B6D0|nr:hypothetical protein [Polaromonas sp.]MDI1339574.1 hypothetical protein [Polaromonas sp.]
MERIECDDIWANETHAVFMMAEIGLGAIDVKKRSGSGTSLFQPGRNKTDL